MPPPCLNPLDLGCVAGAAAQDALTSLANHIIEAVGNATASLATFWIGIPEPTIDSRSGTVGFLIAHTYWLMTAVAVLAVLVGAGKMAWQRRAEPGRELMAAMLRLVVVQGAGVAGIALAVGAAQQFAVWVVDAGTSDFGKDLARMLSLTPGDVGVMAVLLIVIVGIFALLASLVQIALLVARNGFLVVLAGTWQVSAAATNTEAGRAAFARHSAWLLAFILYKPTAGLVYAAAFQLVDPLKGGDRLTNAVSGFALMVLAIVALPALMKLVAPALSAMVGGGGGGVGAAAVVAAAPMGAAFARSPGGSRGAGPAAPSSAGGGSAGGSAGGRGPTGAAGTAPPRGGPSGGGGSAPPRGGPSGGPSGGRGAGAGAGAAAGGPAGAAYGAARAAGVAANVAASQAASQADPDGGTSSGSN